MRLFVALDLPGEVREALRGFQARLRPECSAARWTRPEGMHVTLKFIGHADEDQCAGIREALGRVSSDAATEMRFQGLGFFPNERRPRVLWCGVKAPANLARLAADVEQALEPLGIAAETREYSPHLTLARIGPGAKAARLVRAVNDSGAMDFGSMVARDFFLYQSTLKPSGAEYKKLAGFSLNKIGPDEGKEQA